MAIHGYKYSIFVMIKVFKDQQHASKAMAEDFRDVAVGAVEKRGRFTVALTGGSSPLALYKILASKPYRYEIPWNRSFVFWGDERSVPFDDDQNNAKMAFKTLLNYVSVPGDQIYRMNSEIPPEKTAEEYEKKIKQHFKSNEPLFDLVLLGMGADGHTASIFPGTEVVREQKRWVSTSYNVEQKTDRITLTAPLLNKAKRIFFAVFGKKKAATLKEVMQGEYNPESLPVQLINPGHGLVHWYVDEAAAEFISVE